MDEGGFLKTRAKLVHPDFTQVRSGKWLHAAAVLTLLVALMFSTQSGVTRLGCMGRLI